MKTNLKEFKLSEQEQLSELKDALSKQARNKERVVIALSGFGGSGKSVFAQKLAEILGDTVVISLDDFIVNQLSVRSADWKGFDWGRLVQQVLRPIKKGETLLTYDVYDWKLNQLTTQKKVELPTYIIIEGVGLINNGLDEYFDYKIWIDVSLETATQRGKKRDREEYEVGHDRLWDEVWSSNDSDYHKKHSPKEFVDYMIVSD